MYLLIKVLYLLTENKTMEIVLIEILRRLRLVLPKFFRLAVKYWQKSLILLLIEIVFNVIKRAYFTWLAICLLNFSRERHQCQNNKNGNLFIKNYSEIKNVSINCIQIFID